ncbi:hypothetical protein AYO45_02200 [Gammaproteobacteria bacterium SCGC AG-212-F23]|nr:hypothetical protein AYO45_02200 [Gammaproteobacteria bacterium SCGC AG-212-F23]
MFGHYFQRLTHLTRHYIDWSRIGNLLKSGKHRYSTDEIITRGAIISFTAISAVLGNYFNNSKKTGYSDTSATLICGTIGFLLSHSYVIIPLIKKRCKVSAECNRIKYEISLNITSLKDNPLSPFIKSTVLKIMSLSMSDKEHARASETWGRRLTLLTRVNESFLLQQSEFEKFWTENPERIIEKLSSTPPNVNNAKNALLTLG